MKQKIKLKGLVWKNMKGYPSIQEDKLNKFSNS